MVKFINKVTGGEMWVHETRADEYVKAGHKLATLPSEAPKEEKKPRKKTK